MKTLIAIIIFFAVMFAFSNAQSQQIVPTVACLEFETAKAIVDAEVDDSLKKAVAVLTAGFRTGVCGPITLGIGKTIVILYERTKKDGSKLMVVLTEGVKPLFAIISWQMSGQSV